MKQQFMPRRSKSCDGRGIAIFRCFRAGSIQVYACDQTSIKQSPRNLLGAVENLGRSASRMAGSAGHPDATFAFCVNMARVCTGTNVIPTRVEAPRDRSQKLWDCYGCPIRWKARQARLVLHRNDLDLPFTQYNRELLEMLDSVLDGRLAENARNSGT